MTSFGRMFYLWREKALKKIFEHLDLAILDYRGQTSKVNSEDKWLGYVLSKV